MKQYHDLLQHILDNGVKKVIVTTNEKSHDSFFNEVYQDTKKCAIKTTNSIILTSNSDIYMSISLCIYCYKILVFVIL